MCKAQSMAPLAQASRESNKGHLLRKGQDVCPRKFGFAKVRRPGAQEGFVEGNPNQGCAFRKVLKTRTQCRVCSQLRAVGPVQYQGPKSQGVPQQDRVGCSGIFAAAYCVHRVRSPSVFSRRPTGKRIIGEQKCCSPCWRYGCACRKALQGRRRARQENKPAQAVRAAQAAPEVARGEARARPRSSTRGRLSTSKPSKRRRPRSSAVARRCQEKSTKQPPRWSAGLRRSFQQRQQTQRCLQVAMPAAKPQGPPQQAVQKGSVMKRGPDRRWARKRQIIRKSSAKGRQRGTSTKGSDQTSHQVHQSEYRRSRRRSDPSPRWHHPKQMPKCTRATRSRSEITKARSRQTEEVAAHERVSPKKHRGAPPVSESRQNQKCLPSRTEGVTPKIWYRCPKRLRLCYAVGGTTGNSRADWRQRADLGPHRGRGRRTGSQRRRNWCGGLGAGRQGEIRPCLG